MIWANAPSSNKEFLLAFKSVHVVVSGGLSSQQQRSVETITSTGDAAVKTEERSSAAQAEEGREPSTCCI